MLQNQSGSIDLAFTATCFNVAIGREALVDPNFPLRAEGALGMTDPQQPFASWPTQVAWWLQGRAAQVAQMSSKALVVVSSR